MAPNIDKEDNPNSPKNAFLRARSLPQQGMSEKALKLHQARALALEKERHSLRTPRSSLAKALVAASTADGFEIIRSDDDKAAQDAADREAELTLALEEAVSEAEEARRLAAEAQEKEAATLERLLPDMVAGGEENMRLQATVQRLEMALNKEIEAKKGLEEEVVALRRLVAVLEEAERKSTQMLLREEEEEKVKEVKRKENEARENLAETEGASGAQIALLEKELALRDQEQTLLMQKVMASLATVEANTQERRGEEDREREAKIEKLEDELKTTMMALAETKKELLGTAELKLQITALEKDLREAAIALSKEQDEVKKAEQEKKNQQRLENELNQSLKRMEEELRKAKESMVESEVESKEEKKRTVEVSKQITGLRKQVQQAEEEAQTQTILASKAATRAEELEKQLGEVSLALQKTQKKFGEASKSMEYLTASEKKATQAEADAKKELEVLKIETENRGSEILRLDEALAKRVEELNTMKLEKHEKTTQLEKECSRLKTEVAALREQEAQKASETPNKSRDDALQEVRNMLVIQLEEAKKKTEAEVAKMESAKSEAARLRAETEKADVRALPPRLNLELLEANGEMQGQIECLKEENQKLQKQLTSRTERTYRDDSRLQELFTEDSHASMRIDLLLGEMDRSIGDLSNAMHSGPKRSISYHLSGSQTYRTPDRRTEILDPDSPQRGLSSAAAERLYQVRDERAMLRTAMCGKGTSKAAETLAGELTGRSCYSEETMFMARKRSSKRSVDNDW